jgi:hypothetical protein
MHLESPLTCLAFLGLLAVVGILVAVCLLGPLASMATLWRLRPRDLPASCILTLALSCLLLPATLAMGRIPANCHPVPWPGRLRWGILLALKIVLVQPIMLCGLFVLIMTAPVVPFVPLVIGAAWILILRWTFTDQQRRCPECLRVLMNPVRIGSSSQTFLEWSGDESICSHGHGLLHVPEVSVSYSERPQWVHLDDSWRGLFSEAAGLRHR